jgi:hypothetical protein
MHAEISSQHDHMALNKTNTMMMEEHHHLHCVHHPDPQIHLMIKNLKLPPEKRLKSDSHAILKFVKNLDFFSNKGIQGSDILEISELMTYEYRPKGNVLI